MSMVLVDFVPRQLGTGIHRDNWGQAYTFTLSVSCFQARAKINRVTKNAVFSGKDRVKGVKVYACPYVSVCVPRRSL